MGDLVATPTRLDRGVRRDRQVRRADRRRGLHAARVPVLRRGAAPGRDPDRLLDARDLGPGVHHRPASAGSRAPTSPTARAPRRTRACSPPGATCASSCRCAFGYMMAAKVGTGIVAELGLDADLRRDRRARGDGHQRHDVPVRDAPAGRLLVLPFVYLCSIGAGFFASYLAVVQQIGDVSSGGFFLIFWQFQNPPDLLYQLDQGDGDGHRHRARRLLLRLQRQRRTRSAWAPRRRNRWCLTSCLSISSECSARSSSGAPTRGHQSEAEWNESTRTTRRRREDARRQATAPTNDPARASATRARSTAPRPAAPRSSCRPRSARSRSRARRRDGGEIEERPSGRAGSQTDEGAEPSEESGDARARACRSSTSRRRGRRRPSGASEEEYKWHTYKVYPSGRPDAVEFIDIYKSFGRNAHPPRAEHGPARGDGVDDPRAVRNRQVGLHQAHGRPAVPRRRATSSCTASRCRTCPTTTCSRCARSSGCCSRTARCSAR